MSEQTNEERQEEYERQMAAEYRRQQLKSWINISCVIDGEPSRIGIRFADLERAVKEVTK